MSDDSCFLRPGAYAAAASFVAVATDHQLEAELHHLVDIGVVLEDEIVRRKDIVAGEVPLRCPGASTYALETKKSRLLHPVWCRRGRRLMG